jgi:hypothetical protein
LAAGLHADRPAQPAIEAGDAAAGAPVMSTIPQVLLISMLRRSRSILVVVFAALSTACTEAPPTAHPPVRTAAEWDEWPWTPAHLPTALVVEGASVRPVDSSGWRIGELRLHNVGVGRDTLLFGCGDFGVRLYGDASLSGLPLWDNRPTGDCSLVLYHAVFERGEARSVAVTGFGPSAASRVLPSGRYWAALTLKRPGTLEMMIVPAGEIALGGR